MSTHQLAWRCPYCTHTSETNRAIKKHIELTHFDNLLSKYLKKLATKYLKAHSQ